MIRRLAVASVASILGFVVAGVGPVSTAQAQAYGPDPRVTTGTLDNGLHYLLMPLEARADGSARGAAVRLIVEAGLVHENEGQFGTADVAAQTARIRAGTGATATIEADHAVIGFDLPDNSTLAARLSQMAGIASGAPLTPDTLNAARAAAATQLAGRSPEDRVREQAMRRLVPASRAVRRPAAGLADTVRAISPEITGEFLRRWYVAPNMTVIVAGSGTTDELRGLVQGAFGSLARVPKPASPAPALTSWAPPAGPIVIENPDLTTAMVGVVSARPGREGTGIRDFRSSVVQEAGLKLLETIVNTRITKHKAPFTEVATGRSFGAEGLAWTGFRAMGDAANWRDLVSSAITEVNRIRIHGMDRGDARETLLAMTADWDAKAIAEETAAAGALADMLVQTRGGPSIRQKVELLVSLVGNISADDLEWEFSKRFDPSTAAVVVALPSRPGNPAEADVREVVRSAWSTQPEPTSELVRPWKLMPELPVAGEIVEMSQDAASGVWSGWLSNGIRFHFRQMAGRQPGGVEIGLTIAGGELLEDASTRGLSQMVSASWNSVTLPDLTFEQMSTLFAPSGQRMQAASQPDLMRVTTTTDRGWFNPFMQRLHLMITSSVVTDQAVEQLQDGLRQRLAVVGADPNETFGQVLTDAQYLPGEARIKPATLEMCDAMTASAATAWRERLAACPMEVAIAGDIEMADALEALRFYFGSLPSRPRISPTTFADRREHVTNPLPHAGRRELEVAGSTTTLVMHGFYICEPTDRADAIALLAAASALNGRLTSKAPMLGLPGGGFVSTNFAPGYPGTSFLYYGVQAQALNVEGVAHVVQMVESEFATFAAEGPTDDELAPAIEQLASEAETGMDYPTAWWDHLSTATYRGLSVADLTDSAVRYRAVTREEVRAAFAKYFGRPSNRLDVAVIPPPEDELLKFINNPPPPPRIEEPVQPAGPPGG